MSPAPGTHVVDPALQAMVDQMLAYSPPSAPSPWPLPGQERADWEAEVAALRAEHVAFGRAHRARQAERQAAAPVQDAPAQDAPAQEVGVRREVTLPVAGGTIRARVYAPAGAGPFPALVMFHGGGFWLGGEESGLDDSDPAAQVLAGLLSSVVVNVDYRQAPEHKFPVPLEDCYAATAWVAAHADELGIDAARLSVSGASAGGNLAAGVARLARERSGPAIRLQLLLVPTIDATRSMSSVSAVGQGFELTSQGVAEAWDMYVEPGTDRTDPRLSPLLAEDLAGLPAAHIVVATFDPLRDEGVAFAARLRAAGVPTTLTELPMTHSLMTPDVMADYIADLVAAVHRANGTPA